VNPGAGYYWNDKLGRWLVRHLPRFAFFSL